MATTAESLQKDAEIAETAAEFQKLCIQRAKNTKNILTCTGPWPSDVYNVPKELRNRIGSVISFLQENKPLFCEEDEYLLLYNFQNISHLGESSPSFYALQLRIISGEETADLSTFNKGRPLNLTIDEEGNIGHAEYALEMMEYYESGVLQEDATEPYGNFYDYPDPKLLVSNPQPLSLTEKLETLISTLSDGSERQEIGVKIENEKEVLSYRSDFDLSITYSFNVSTLDAALIYFDVPSEMPSPSSPFAAHVERSPSRYSHLGMQTYLDCSA